MVKRKYYPVIGKVYGDLTVISNEIQKTNNDKIKYHVKCKCGKELWVRAYFLEIGRQTCCKSCSSKNAIQKSPAKDLFIKHPHKGVGDLNRSLYDHYKRNARRRGLEWNLSIEYLWNLFESQKRKCALSGIDLTISPDIVNSSIDFKNTTASLDRIDSSKGYIPGNVQWVHKDINKMKLDHDQDYFIELCRKIAEYNNLRNQQSDSALSDSET